LEYRPKVGRAGRNRALVTVDGTIARDRDIPTYVNEYFYSCMEKWALTKMWGLAHNKGWADEPVEYINAISVLENEHNKIEAEEMEQKTSKIKNGKE
jgi:hypothetical protein